MVRLKPEQLDEKRVSSLLQGYRVSSLLDTRLVKGVFKPPSNEKPIPRSSKPLTNVQVLQARQVGPYARGLELTNVSVSQADNSLMSFEGTITDADHQNIGNRRRQRLRFKPVGKESSLDDD